MSEEGDFIVGIVRKFLIFSKISPCSGPSETAHLSRLPVGGPLSDIFFGGLDCSNGKINDLISSFVV